MAVITLTIPDAVLSRVVGDICTYYGYMPTLPNGQTNPETQNAFAKRMIIANVIQACNQVEGNAAQQTAIQNIQSIITIT